jgi:hypothetical protein
MTDRKLLQQALNALKVMRPACFAETTLKAADTAINALRDRLAQPEQELMIDCPRCGHCCPQPNQEPVGWFGYDTGVRAWFETNKGDDDSIPLYKAPRQCPTCESLARTVMMDQTGYDPRPWVGLTDEEIKSLPSWWPSYEDAPALIQLVKDVEAKLREKNGG